MSKTHFALVYNFVAEFEARWTDHQSYQTAAITIGEQKQFEVGRIRVRITAVVAAIVIAITSSSVVTFISTSSVMLIIQTHLGFQELRTFQFLESL